MDYKLEYKNSALRYLRRMQKGHKKRFQEAHKKIAQNPHAKIIKDKNGVPYDISPLEGREEGRRLRIGGYRSKYVLDDKNKIMTVRHVGPRGDAYKKKS